MGTSVDVFRGFWYHHSRGLILTVDENWYTVITSIIGICFGLAQPCVERVFAHIWAWVSYSWYRFRQRRQATNGIADRNSTNTRVTDPLLPQDTSSGEDKSKKCCGTGLSVRDVLAKLLSLIGIAYVILSTFITSLPSEKLARSGSSECGLWGLRDDANDAAQDADALVQGQKETRAGLYARNCYGRQSSPDLDQCALFAESKIEFDMHTDQECPFVNSTYCASTGFTAVRFSTGNIDATEVGLNAQRAPKLRRTSICVPLNLDGGFVNRLSHIAGHWGYDLGPVESKEYWSDYTFVQSGDPFYYDVRAYTMSTYVHVYSKSKEQNYWQPIPALNVRPEVNNNSAPYSLTLMFINSCRIFYEENSHDDVFPADRRWRNGDLWTNNDSRARPLACLDWIEVCTDDGHCSPSHEPIDDDDPNIAFTKVAVNKSTTFDAIEYRGATGLEAQEMIKDDTSLPLSKDPSQWIAESRALFRTSLARIQYDALDFANGVGRDRGPMYEPKLPDSLRKELCHSITFQLPKDYNNIDFWPTIGILSLPFAFWLVGVQTDMLFSFFGIPREVDFGDAKKASGCFEGLKMIRIERFISWLASCCNGPRKSRVSPPSRPPDPNAPAAAPTAQGTAQPGPPPPNYGSTIPAAPARSTAVGAQAPSRQQSADITGAPTSSQPPGASSSPAGTGPSQEPGLTQSPRSSIRSQRPSLHNQPAVQPEDTV